MTDDVRWDCLQLRCTGQVPNSSLLQASLPSAVLPTGFVRTRRTLQVAPLPSSSSSSSSASSFPSSASSSDSGASSPTSSRAPSLSRSSYSSLSSTSTSTTSIASDSCWAERMYAIGDVAEAGVIKAGHTGWNQAGVAVQNIMAQIMCERAGTGTDGDEGAQPQLVDYEPSPPQIKVTLGLVSLVQC